MDKKSVSAIKRLIKPDKAVIDRLYGCYFDGGGGIIMMQKKSCLSKLSEESSELYHKILAKTLSGKIGKNLFNLTFPFEQEEKDGSQHLLYQLLKNPSEDNLDYFFHRIIETYEVVGSALIILAHGTWDIPRKGKDRDDEDASEGVYEFYLCSICPILNAAEGLAYDSKRALFTDYASFLVTRPDAGFLFPAFHDRAQDVHSCLYYARKDSELHQELITDFLCCPLPENEESQKMAFRDLIENGLGKNCTAENVAGVYDSVAEYVDSCDDEEDAPPEIGKAQIERILKENGADSDAMKGFAERYDEVMKDTPFLAADNITENGKVTVKGPGFTISLNADFTGALKTRKVDGVEYFVLPITEATVNGVPVVGEG